MDEDNFLELLDLYMDMVEKQDEIIYRLGKIVARQATDLKLLQNDQAFTGFCFWMLQKHLEKREKRQDEKEAAREKNEILMVKSIGAAIALGEATAEAVSRIPDAHCNGDMHAALEYARKIKHEQKDFFVEQSVHEIY